VFAFLSLDWTWPVEKVIAVYLILIIEKEPAAPTLE